MRKLVMLTIFMFALVSGFGGGSLEENSDYLHHNFPKDSRREITILSSIPSGSPLNIDDIRCQLMNCSGFGRRFHPIHKMFLQHKGIDLSAPPGTPVISTSYGYVSRTEHSRYGYGNNVRIRSGDYKTLYAHLKEILVEEGQSVSVGDTIGTVGSTGSSTAPHLHYEVRLVDGDRDIEIDPLRFILNK